MQRADARRVEHLRHFLSDGTHIQRRAFAAGRVAGVKHGVRPGLVALGGMGVHDEHLRQGTVLFNGKRQILRRHSGAQVSVGVLGAVSDAACGQCHIAVAAALPERHAADAARVVQLRRGAGQRRGSGGRLRRGRRRSCRGRGGRRRGHGRGAAVRLLGLVGGPGGIRRPGDGRSRRGVLQKQRPAHDPRPPGADCTRGQNRRRTARKCGPAQRSRRPPAQLLHGTHPLVPEFYAIFLVSMKFFSKSPCNFAKSVVG